MDGWDDLFAKASGRLVNVQQKDDSSVQATRSDRIGGDEDGSIVSRRRKKKSSSGFKKDTMLAGRIVSSPQISADGDFAATFPVWVCLLEPMVSGSCCPGYETSLGGAGTLSRCSHCDRDPLEHRMILRDKSDRSRLWPCQLFSSLRNLRCCAVSIALQREKPIAWVNAMRNEKFAIQEITERSFHEFHNVSRREASLLQTKCETLIHQSTKLTKTAAASKEMDLFEDSVRVIVACDDLYYRLYYLQLTEQVPAESVIHDGQQCYFPHPTEYFQIPYLTGDICKAEETLVAFVSQVERVFADSSQDSKPDMQALRDVIKNRYGLSRDTGSTLDNPLTALHRSRFLETVALFHGSKWIATENAQKQTFEAMEKHRTISPSNLAFHDTTAPQVLSEWRHSCRDLLCNLYSYATLSPGTEEWIKAHLHRAESSRGIIEMGAGTGFVAMLLQKAGIEVTALDAIPTSATRNSTNEYHGFTPPFVDVRFGEPKSLIRFSNLAKFALLLCYPPPQCEMARDSLKGFLRSGGKCFIHIGEFRGLTGSSKFESLLLSSFSCIGRRPCLTWGTDAAEVSVWISRISKGVPHSRSFLLPCSHCGHAEAKKRCTLVRHIVFCSEKCFKAHSTLLQAQLAMSLVAVDAQMLDYRSDLHFAPLCLSTQKIEKRGAAKNSSPHERIDYKRQKNNA